MSGGSDGRPLVEGAQIARAAVVRAPKIAPSPVPPPDATTSTDGGGMAAMASGPVTWIATLVGTGTGTVTSTPSGLTCTGGEVSCAGTFDAGTPVTFTATSGSGSTFGGWAGACTGMASTCQVTITEAQTVIAIFTGPPAVTYYHTDILGSVRAITDAAGAVLTRHDSFPFGESTSPLTGDPRRFTGKELDPETALQYFDARYYRNVWGRMIAADPVIEFEKHLLDPQRWNRYAYVRNNPLGFVDPTGAAIELVGSAEERRAAFTFLISAVPDLGDYLYINELVVGGQTRYFVGIKGDVDAFKKVSEQANGLTNLILHKQVVELEVTNERLPNSVGGAATYEPGERNGRNLNTRVVVNSQQVRSTLVPGSLWVDTQFARGRIRPMTGQIALWHELGHAWGFISGRPINPDTHHEALAWENLMRSIVYGPLGPNNAPRVRHR